MINDIHTFLRYFDAVNRRALRDVGTLPPAAESWSPPAGEGESAWGVGQLVSHMAGSRIYFAHAYRDEGWITDLRPQPAITRAEMLAALEESAGRFHDMLAGTPNAWLERRIELIDTPGATIAGWRVLMMMVEHDVHHRSQIDTYAGLNGWPVAQIYGRTAEQIGKLQDEQHRKHSPN